MLGLVATWLVVMALLLAFGWRTGDALLETSSNTHLRYEAGLIADDLTHQVQSRLGALERLGAELDDEHGAGEATVQDQLHRNGALLEWFDWLVVMGADGRLAAMWPEKTDSLGADLSFRDYFRQVRDFRQPYVSEPFVSFMSDIPMVMFTVPRLDAQGHFLGVIGGAIRLNGDRLFRRLDRLRLGERGYASVMSVGGTYLYHPEDDQVLRTMPEDELSDARSLALLGWEGEAREPLADHGIGYRAYRQIWPANWIVSVTLPRDQVMAPLAGWARRLGWWFVPVACLLLPMIGWVLWLTLRPLMRLERQIEQVGRGLRNRVTLKTRMHELQQVAETFNRVEVERSQALISLQQRQAFLDATLASSPVGMFVTDTAGNMTYMNPVLVELTGFTLADDAKREWAAYVHPDDRDTLMELWHYRMASGESLKQQFRYCRLGGETLWLEVHAGPVANGGEALGFVGTVKDITARREEEALRQWEAEHDPLTGLLNRRGFERRLEEALADWRKTGTPSSLILFDLDHFKPINDEGGHALGDEMLKRIAQVIAWEVRGSDHVARQGGDEFAVLLPSCTPQHAEKIARTLVDAVGSVDVQHEGRTYRVTLSLGLTSFREGDQRIAAVIERADAASYRAKREGRNRAVICHGASD
ncbi:diguanylate cyclase [Halomonas sp. YJPS3-2]|nr:diguanylate cyclase [Halomonas getboli]MCK2184400.1 diguanylate cyclase [Halomonas getboli]